MNRNQTLKFLNMRIDQWLWCLHCERFFQARHLKPDITGGNEGCAFDGCDGAGIDVDIFEWDSWAEQNDLSHWPKSIHELSYGLEVSLYPNDNT